MGANSFLKSSPYFWEISNIKKALSVCKSFLSLQNVCKIFTLSQSTLIVLSMDNYQFFVFLWNRALYKMFSLDKKFNCY